MRRATAEPIAMAAAVSANQSQLPSRRPRADAGSRTDPLLAGLHSGSRRPKRRRKSVATNSLRSGSHCRTENVLGRSLSGAVERPKGAQSGMAEAGRKQPVRFPLPRRQKRTLVRCGGGSRLSPLAGSSRGILAGGDDMKTPECVCVKKRALYPAGSGPVGRSMGRKIRPSEKISYGRRPLAKGMRTRLHPCESGAKDGEEPRPPASSAIS